VALRLEDASGAVLPTDAEAERVRADALEAKLAALLAERSGSQR
jgi:hypothetical protein